MSRAGRSRRRRAAAVALACLALPSALAAQSLEGSAGGYALQHRVLYHKSVYDQAGTIAEAGLSVRVGPALLDVGGWGGRLAGAGGLPNGDATIRTTAVALHLALLADLLVGVQLETRRFSSAVGVTIWQLKGWDVRFQPELGFPGLRGIAAVALLSSSRVRDGPRMDVAVQTTMGITYALRGSRFRVRLAYRFERYDLRAPATGSARLEQFRGVVAGASLLLFRAGPRRLGR